MPDRRVSRLGPGAALSSDLERSVPYCQGQMKALGRGSQTMAPDSSSSSSDIVRMPRLQPRPLLPVEALQRTLGLQEVREHLQRAVAVAPQ